MQQQQQQQQQKQNQQQNNKETDLEVQGFGVQPKTNCPHLTQEMDQNLVISMKLHGQKLFSLPCSDCNDQSENWLCLTCQQIYCSRYVKSHMLAHNQATDHPIALSFSDLSFWCYECDYYITTPNLDQRRVQVSNIKYNKGSQGKSNLTNHKTEEEKQEFFDPPEVLDKKVNQLVEMIKKSKHFIAFTGAGISTSTGIPDFRSGANTVLKTGAGCWEEMANEVNSKKKDLVRVSTLCAIPSSTHMSCVALEKKGLLKFVISQNVDGLHRRSGLNPDKIAELHGNTNLEKCKKCKKKYLRDYDTSSRQMGKDHRTGRQCDDQKCKGELEDSIINFGENLPEEDIYNGFRHSELADLCLVLGSSLRVTPAANMPQKVGERKKDLVIVNLQRTPLDNIASLRINAFCDQVMELVMKKLQIQIPEFTLIRRVGILNNEKGLLVQGLDQDNLPYSLFKGVELNFKNLQNIQQQPQPILLRNEPFIHKLNDQQKIQDQVKLNLQFQGHYGEPDLSFEVQLNSQNFNKKQVYVLAYSPKEQQWIDVMKQSDQ